MPHYRFNDAQVATLSGFLLAKTDSDLLANVHLEAATPEQIAHGKRLVSDYGCASCHEICGHQEARKLCARTQPHRKQAGHSTRFPAGHAAHASRLHRSQDQAAACVWTSFENAAVHVHASAD